MFVRNPLNEGIYKTLNQIADLLEWQDASPFKINAYRNAATEIARMPEDLKKTALKRDLKKLEALPGIGEGIGRLIIDYYQNGHSRYLKRLIGDVSFEHIIEQIPGIGPALTDRIIHQLNIDTLEELELAVYDGRLASVPGFGKARMHLIKLALEGLLNKRKAGTAWQSNFEFPLKVEAPSINLLLEIDGQYRKLAAENKLKKIAPKRFNPENETWLPIFHTEQRDWHFTVLFSNTARAHQLNKQYDWVIIYYQKEGVEGQVTVVTETRGNLKGNRVIRGWEEESEKFYALPLFLESQTD